MTEGTRLLAQGRPITLADGSTVHLRYGLHALALLEQEFGTLASMYRIVTAKGDDRQAFSYLGRMLAAGLWQIVDNGREMSVAELVIALDAQLDPKHMPDYEDAIVLALGDAFPDAPAPAAGKAKVPNATGPRARGASRGPGTTGSARSGTAARRRSSGR